MSFLDSVGGAVGSALGSVANGMTKGAKNNFHADEYRINNDSFTDPNAQANKQALAQALSQRNAMADPTMSAAQAGATPYDASQQAQFRGQQSMLANQLMQQANGQGPSIAQMQMQHGMDQAIAAQHAQAASARGVSPGMAQRMAAQNIGSMQGQAANDAGMMRMQEQMNARGQLGQLLGGARGQDIGMAGDQAQLGQQLNLANAGFQNQAGNANLNAALTAQGQKDAMSQYYTGAGLGIDQNSYQGAMALQQLGSQNYNATQGINAGVAAGNSQMQMQALGGLLSAGGAAGAAAIGKG